MPLKAKNNVNKKRKAKEKTVYKKYKDQPLSPTILHFAEKIGHQYIFYRGVVKKSYIKVEYNHNDKARSLTYWNKKKLKHKI